MKAKKIKAWAIVNQRGVVREVFAGSRRVAERCARHRSKPVYDYEQQLVAGSGTPHHAVPLTGTFTPRSKP